MSRGNKTETIVDVIKSMENQGFSNEEYIARIDKENKNLNDTIDRLLLKITEYEQEIINLRRILEGGGDSGLLAPISDEEMIADIQLKRLMEKAKFGELNLEEIKKFDLLVKNKRLAQGKSTQNNKHDEGLPQLPKKDLISIAGRKRTEEK